MGNLRPLYFRLFKQFLLQLNVKNVMSIQYTPLGSNSQPFEHKSSPITTRPGLSPQQSLLHKPKLYCNLDTTPLSKSFS